MTNSIILLQKSLAVRIDKLLSGMVRQQQLEDRLNEFSQKFVASADESKFVIIIITLTLTL